MSATTVARLKITLDDVNPAILRRVEVPFDIRVDRLHLTIQAAMGWTSSHLYEIRVGDVGFSTPDPDADWDDDFLDARKARLDDVLEDIGTKKLVYLRRSAFKPACEDLVHRLGPGEGPRKVRASTVPELGRL